MKDFDWTRLFGSVFCFRSNSFCSWTPLDPFNVVVSLLDLRPRPSGLIFRESLISQDSKVHSCLGGGASVRPHPALRGRWGALVQTLSGKQEVRECGFSERQMQREDDPTADFRVRWVLTASSSRWPAIWRFLAALVQWRAMCRLRTNTSVGCLCCRNVADSSAVFVKAWRLLCVRI